MFAPDKETVVVLVEADGEPGCTVPPPLTGPVDDDAACFNSASCLWTELGLVDSGDGGGGAGSLGPALC